MGRAVDVFVVKVQRLSHHGKRLVFHFEMLTLVGINRRRGHADVRFARPCCCVVIRFT